MKTPCQKWGYKVGDKFKVLHNHAYGFKVGATVALFEDDGSDRLLFSGECHYRCADGAPGAYMSLSYVKPIKPKKAKRPWIKWEGGECPVPEGALIDVKYRDGHKQKGCPAGPTPKEFERNASFWGNAGAPGDIIAYRLAKPKKAAEPAPSQPEPKCPQDSTCTDQGCPHHYAESAQPEWEILWGSAEDFEGAPDWAVYVSPSGSFLEDVIRGARLSYGDGEEGIVRGVANCRPKAARRLKQPK